MATGIQDQQPSMKQALVAGGQASFVTEKLSKSLARHGIRIHTHWSWDKKKPPHKFPDNIDLVYICTDMIGHNLANPCVDYARETGIPYVNGTRKWAESIERLTGAGFPLLDPIGALPEIVREATAGRSPKEMAEGPTAEDLRGILVAITGSSNPSTANLPLSPQDFNVTTQAALQESPLMSASDNVHLAVTNPKQREYLRVLAHRPDADNVEIWESLNILPLFAGAKFDPERASHARRSLGVSIVRKGGKRTTNVNITMFNATLKTAKIEGYPAPRTQYVEPDAAFRNAGSPPAPAAAPAPAPVVEVVPPPAPAPAPVTKPVQAPLPTPVITPMSELKDIVALLRDKMKEMNIVDLHVTPNGVKYKQVTVVEGSLED